MDNSANLLQMLGRKDPLFSRDLDENELELTEAIQQSRFLVIGGAGSIGQAVVRELFKRQPRVLHIVDISENNMVELVRDLRSSMGYINGDFRTFSIDCGSTEFEALINVCGPYDYVFNLSALKHVRSERDPFTLMRMIEVNILNTVKTIELTKGGLTKYFCVSTDKAANPVNMMGASKRIMEMFLVEKSNVVTISTARFANVAFSNGSLLDGFKRRFDLHQPLSAPSDVQRYFVTAREAGELCIMSGMLGKNNEIFFPNNKQLMPMSFSSIAIKFLESKGYQAVECCSEEEARSRVGELSRQKKWPVHFTHSDTTGEKPCEEFYTSAEKLDLHRYNSIGIVENSQCQPGQLLEEFLNSIKVLRSNREWKKEQLVTLFQQMIPEFKHHEKGRFLDQKM